MNPDSAKQFPDVSQPAFGLDGMTGGVDVKDQRPGRPEPGRIRQRSERPW